MMRIKNKNLGMAMLIATGAFNLQSCSDDNNDIMSAPTAIQNVFNTQYPNASRVDWEFSGGLYEVDFYFSGIHAEWGIPLNGVEAEAWYAVSGEWQKTVFDITNLYAMDTNAVIPIEVKATIATESNGSKVDDVDIVDLPKPAEDYFLVEIDSEPTDKYVSIRFDGSVIR